MATRVSDTYYFRRKGNGGGGGGSSDAVKYTEQTLTEAQQMQARKNLDLYWGEIEDIGDVTFTASYDWSAGYKTLNLDTQEYLDGCVTQTEISGEWSYPTMEQIVGSHYISSGSSGWGQHQSAGPQGTQVEITSQMVFPLRSDNLVYGIGSSINDIYIVVVLPQASTNTFTLYGYTVTVGNWGETGRVAFYSDSDGTAHFVDELVYHLVDAEINLVPSKYLPITTSLSASSTNNEVPGAKAVYDTIGNIETLLSAL